jgi:glycosyltransferase involved in cell wall biosynthesis
VRVAVYDVHWATLGGGEQLAGGIATALARDHDVELLVGETFDAVVASERLGFDLTALPQREVEPGSRPLLKVSSDYDLFVNTSFANMQPTASRYGFYYVHFPMPHDPIGGPSLASRIAAPAFPDARQAWIERSGFWLREFPGYGCWSKGEAWLDLVLPRGLRVPFGMTISARHWPAGRAPHVRVTLGSEELFDGPLDPRADRQLQRTVVGRGVADPIAVAITTDTFVPRLAHGGDDDRELGVVVSHAYLGRAKPPIPEPVASRFGLMPKAPFVGEFLESYQVVAANSAYTASWVTRLWGRHAELLAPPVRLRDAGPKQPIILAVGRFFPSSSGHSKKQLELVEAFRIACARGLQGWELHLVGGCKHEDRGYVEDVRAAAVGLPVFLHVNARGEDLAELFASARVYWHGGGLGEDPEHHPDRFEHFGITVVEAMSAAAVPLVYEIGGPATIVRDAGCGRVFSSVEQLATQTVELVRAPAELDRFAELAERRGADFAFDRFAARLRELVQETVDTDTTPRALER